MPAPPQPLLNGQRPRTLSLFLDGLSGLRLSLFTKPFRQTLSLSCMAQVLLILPHWQLTLSGAGYIQVLESPSFTDSGDCQSFVYPWSQKISCPV